MIPQLLRASSVLGALAFWPALARAAPGDATRLEYARSEGAARCPDGEALKGAVRDRLGYDPFFPAARQTIAVEITDADAGLRAQMHLIDENGIIVGGRELHERADQCDELVRSLALAISIALDPSAALGAEPTAPSAESNPPAAPASIDEPQPPAVPVASTKSAAASPNGKDHARPLRGSAPIEQAPALPLTLRASVVATQGVLPAVSSGFRLGGSLRWTWFQVLTEFTGLFPATHAAHGGGSVKGSLYEGTLAPCFTHSSLAACAVLNLGSLLSQGVAVPEPVKDASLYVALGVRAEYQPQLTGAWHLLVDASALKSLTPSTLRLRGETVWQTPWASFELGVGVAWRFP